ncbi:MAG: hypothetical protein ABI345_08610 [Jatrophihabitans sp.]
MDEGSEPVIGVVGGSGGVGASTFAAVLTLAAGPAVLVDLDCSGGGVDVLLGIEQSSGARWSGLRVAGGHLDPDDLVGGLPRFGSIAVLAADVGEIDPDAVRQVIGAAARRGPVVVDLPRVGGPERAAALERCDLVVVLVRTDVSGLVAAHTMVTGMPEVALGLVARRGEVDADEAAVLVGAALIGVLPPAGGRLVLDPVHPPRTALRVAAGVLAALRDRRALAS